MANFKLLDKSMGLYSATVRITTNVAKKYKMNYVKVLQNLAEEIYFCIYKGNESDIKTKKELYNKALIDIKIYNEFTLQAQYDGCLQIEQKCELDETINEVERMLKAVILGLES